MLTLRTENTHHGHASSTPSPLAEGSAAAGKRYPWADDRGSGTGKLLPGYDTLAANAVCRHGDGKSALLSKDDLLIEEDFLIEGARITATALTAHQHEAATQQKEQQALRELRGPTVQPLEEH